MGKNQLVLFPLYIQDAPWPGLNFAVIENCADKMWKAQYSLVCTPVKWGQCLLLSSVKTV